MSNRVDQETELRDLMLLSLKGDGVAYAQLMERIAGMVRLRLKRSTRTAPEQIEDLVQDVLLAVHNKRQTYRTDLPLLPWLHTITRFKLIDSLRAQGREPAFAELNDETDQDSYQTGDAAAAFADRDDVEQMLASLPERQREIIRLAKIEDVPLQEISTRLNMTLANVKVNVHRALASLRKSQGVEEREEADNE